MQAELKIPGAAIVSVEAVSAVLHGAFEIDPSEKLILLILAEHARRGTNLAWPSVPTLARLACLKDRQVQTILRLLLERGYIETHYKSQGGRPNVYRINLVALAEERRKNDAVRRTVDGAVARTVERLVNTVGTVQSRRANGAGGSANGAVECGVTVQPAAPKPVLNLLTGVQPGAPERVRGTTTPDGTATPINRKLNGEPERQERTPATRAEKTAEELEVERQRQLRAVAALQAKAVRQ